MDFDKNLIIDYLNGNLSGEDAAALDRKLAVDPHFRTEFELEKKLWKQIEMLQMVNQPEPSDKMRSDFYAMLKGYQHAVEKEEKSVWVALKGQIEALFQWQYAPHLAIGLICLCVGYFGGMNLSQPQQEMERLSSEMQQMRELMMVTLMEQPSASQRMKGIQIANELNSLDQKTISVLFQTLHSDTNVNVRLSAVDALFRMAHYPTVREGLIRSLTQQDSPLVQAALVDVLVALQEKTALDSMKQMLQKEDLNRSVKIKLEQGIEYLM